MTTLIELSVKWEARRVEHQRLGSLVSAEAIISDVLNDLHELEDSTNTATYSLTEAGQETGHSTQSAAVCRACAEVCRACAASCDAIGDDMMRRCAEECRRCAESCEKMASMSAMT